jgi:hypothetical protein
MSFSRNARLFLARRAGQAPKRRRGAQPGNRNALRHGKRAAAAIERARELSALLADVKKAIACAKPFIGRQERRSPSPNGANE